MDKAIRRCCRKIRAGVDRFPKSRRRTLAVAVIGAVLLVVGAAMLVLPGPGLLVMALGLALLSVEFVWAQMIVRQMRHLFVLAKKRRRARNPSLRKLRPARLDSAT